MFYASSPDALHQAFAGSLAADALAMPVHWYYDRTRLRSDYGLVDRYLPPLPHHPGSILHRSHYTALNKKGDILHDQAKWWGQTGIHYHQFLQAGENTLNYQLARRLYEQVSQSGGYQPKAWLDNYINFMLTPGQHSDTYVEEYHRAFFTHYARGKKPTNCGIDDNHIGGLAQVPALLAALPPADEKTQRAIIHQHVSLTHKNPGVLQAADTLTRLLLAIAGGQPVRLAIESLATSWFSARKAASWSTQPDEIIVGRVFSPACYIGDSFPAALYLAWKHATDFSAGIIANTMCGGDNCHRAAVTGSLLAAAHGLPPRWTTGLLTPPPSPLVPHPQAA